MKIAILDSGISEQYKEECNHIESVCDDKGIDRFGHGNSVYQTFRRYAGEGVKIDIIKVLDNYGRTDVNRLIDGLRYCIRNDVNIVNLSLSFTKKIGDYKKNILQEIINKLTQQKKYIICSAENRKYDDTSVPASLDGVYGVCGALMKDEKGFYYDEHKKIQILGNATPIIVYDLNGNRKLFGGNSKATAVISGIVSKHFIRAKADVKSFLQEEAINYHWDESNLNIIEQWTRDNVSFVKYCDNGTHIHNIIDEYRKLHNIDGSVLNKYILINGKSVLNCCYFLDLISYIENRLNLKFLNDSISLSDFRNEAILVDAIINRWKKIEK